MKCYFSYFRDEVDDATVDELEAMFRRGLDDNSLAVERELDTLRREIDAFDAVVVFLTPGYKREVDSRQGRLFQEFGLIRAHYQKVQEQKRIAKSGSEVEDFDVFLVLLQGDLASTVPDELRRCKLFDLTGLRLMRHSKGPTEVSKLHAIEISRWSSSVQAVGISRKLSLQAGSNRFYQALFVDDLKADWSDMPIEYVEQVFVKTHAYKRIEKHTVYFVIGRKGSGKSTVTDVLFTLIASRRW